MFFTHSARVVLCLGLLAFGLGFLSAQTTPLIYYLGQVHLENSGGMMGGPDWWSSSDLYYLTDTDDPLVTTSYRYVSNYWEEAYHSYSDDTYPFSGAAIYFPDHFVVTSKNGLPSTTPPYRISTIDYNGYYLRDDYCMTANSQTPVMSRIYQYNQDMKLTCIITRMNNISKWWRTECTLDELGRRTQDYTSVSSDSLNWLPYCRNEYTYSSELVPGNPQFEKHALYVPLSFDIPPFNIFPYLYINDNYKMVSVTVTFANTQGDWYESDVWPLDYRTIPWGFQLGAISWDNHGLVTELAYGDGDGMPSYTFGWAFTDPSDSSDPLSPDLVGLSVNPNPVRDDAELQLTLKAPASIKVTTYNLRGQQIKSEIYQDRKVGENSLVWRATDTAGSPLKNGVYLIRCETPGSAKTIRTVVIH